MEWFWPQYYFAGMYGVTLLLLLLTTAHPEYKIRIRSILTSIILIFNIYVMHLGGFW